MSQQQSGEQNQQGNKNGSYVGRDNSTFGNIGNISGTGIALGTFTYNQTEILQISEREITSRKLNTTSPYKGLEAFKSRDKELFFGRDNFTTTLVNKLEQTNLVLLLGASGSGKSSVVRAGLIPWLERKHGTKFINLTLTPDNDPFESFYASLLGNYSQKEAKIAREINSETLVNVAKNLKQADEFWFIFIDQFEELFTISDENKRREFINGLVKLSKANLPDIKIMATMRADFFERLSDFSQLVEATQEHRPMIVEMQSSELRLAIEQPAAHYGVVFEAGLVDKIISEVQGQAGCLPLLQYTLNLIWQDEIKTGSIHDRVLNLSTYENLGGVRGALQQHVDSIYKEFSESKQQATQRIFLKLVDIGKNAESGIEWKPVRRRAMLSEFRDDERDVLLKLVNENLLVSNADLSKTDSKRGLLPFPKSVKSSSTVEIAHEILLTCWDKLKNWIEKNRQGIAIRNRLYEDVKRWKDKKPEDELWTGSKLEQVLELSKDSNFNQVLGGFNDDAKQFIDASLGVRDQQLRESIVSITKNVKPHLRENNQLDAMVEAVRAAKKFNNLRIGKDDVAMAVVGSLRQAVYHNQNGYRERLRLKGDDVTISPDGKILATTDDNIVRVWNATTGELLQELTGHQKRVTSVVFSPDGKQLATTASDDKTARVWDALTGEQLQQLSGHLKGVTSVVFSPDGKQLATTASDKTARVWNASTGKLLQTLKGHQLPVTSVVFSHDGNQLATASRDKTARLWDATTGKPLQELKGHQKGVTSVVFSPDGNQLATTASFDKTARVWNATTGKLLQQLSGHQREVTSVVFSPDSKQLATASHDKTARLWNAITGKQLQELKGHQSRVTSVVFSPEDGKQLATTAFDDNTARLWDATTGELSQQLKGHQDTVKSVVFSRDGKQLATASTDKTARLWDATTGELLQELKKHQKGVRSVVFSPDGKQLATTALRDKTAQLWDASTRELLQELKGHQGEVTSVVFSPDGNQLATTALRDKTARVWSATTGELLQELKEHKSSVRSVVFSPDGNQLATASDDNTARVWDASNGELLQELKGHQSSVTSVVFSPDGKLLADASDKTARVWDASNGKLLQELEGHKSRVRIVVFSPDGKQLATASDDNTARLWDATTGELLQQLKGRRVRSVVFSPEGNQLATALLDNTVRLWDASTGEQLQELKGHQSQVKSVVFSPDGKQLATTASRDKTARLWNATTGEQLQELKGHKDTVWSVVFSPDGKQLATASEDKTARIWRVGDMEDMLAINCDWVRGYLESNPDVEEEDRDLCEGVGTFEN